MSKWKMVKLADVTSVITCGVAKRPEYVDKGIMFLSSKNVKEDNIYLDDYNCISEKDFLSLTKHNKPEKGDILYTRVGSFGEAAVINFDIDFAIFVSLTLIKPIHEKVFNRYLMYYLNSSKTKEYAGRNTTGIGVQNLNVSVVREYQVPLPPLETQKQIANTLDTAAELLAMRKQQHAELDNLIKATFYDMFGDPLTNKKGWGVKKLKDLVKNEKYSLKRGPFGGSLTKEMFVKSGFLVYEQYHAINDDFSMQRYYISDEKFEELKAFEVKPGDLIVSCSGVTLGRIAELPPNALTGVINQALLKISLDNSIISNEFFKFVFRDKATQNILFSVSRGSGIPNFPPMDMVRNINFILPPLPLQNQFAEIVTKIEEQKALVKKAIDETQYLFNSLMSEYFD